MTRPPPRVLRVYLGGPSEPIAPTVIATLLGIPLFVFVGWILGGCTIHRMGPQEPPQLQQPSSPKPLLNPNGGARPARPNWP